MPSELSAFFGTIIPAICNVPDAALHSIGNNKGDLTRIETLSNTENSDNIAPRRTREHRVISEVATIMCISMYVAYIPQIIGNFTGNPVSPVQPFVTSLDAVLWVMYGWTEPHKDWPIIISNFPGIIFGVITVVTAYVH